MRAQAIFRQTGRATFGFDMSEVIGEGFTRGGADLLETTNVRAVFRKGRIHTLYPQLGPLP